MLLAIAGLLIARPFLHRGVRDRVDVGLRERSFTWFLLALS